MMHRESVRLCKTAEWNSATTYSISVLLVSLQPTQPGDMISKAHTTHSFKCCCVYIVKNEGFHVRLRKPWITTTILRSMDNKEKLHQKYVNQKRFLINTVLHQIFKRNRNINKNSHGHHYFNQCQNDMKRTWKKIMQIANVNKRFTTFPTMTKHEKH